LLFSYLRRKRSLKNSAIGTIPLRLKECRRILRSFILSSPQMKLTRMWWILKNLFSRRSRFSFSLEETRRFPNALYLAPRPDALFKELTQVVTERYPGTLPYGGAFSTVIPHLTIAQVADLQQLDKIGDEFKRASKGRLPLQSYAEKVWLMQKREGRWKLSTSFTFDIASGP
jgi:2'-5' RNA ligase superfamily